MKRKTKRTIISLFLIVCLFVNVVPAVTLAEEIVAEATQTTTGLEDLLAGVVSVEEFYGNLDSQTVPEIIGYDYAVSKAHVQRLYEKEGDHLDTVIFQNADGTETAYVFDYPVKYVDAKGVVRDITLDIADSAVIGGFETANSSAVTTFSRNLSDGIALRGNNTMLSLVPHLPMKSSNATRSNTAALTADSTVKRIDRKTVAYEYDSKTTIEYSLTYTGFKEDIVVSEYTGQTEYEFTLYTNGLTLKEIDDAFYLVDGSSVVKATLGDIIIFTADEKNNTMGELSAKTVIDNQEYLLTISVDAAYLAAPETVYPIRIDPTVELSYDNNGSGAIQDVTLNSLQGSSGSSGSLLVGLRETYGKSRILMKFPGLDLDALGDNIIITEATVELRDLMCETTGLEVSCYVFTGNVWDESTANWSNVSPDSFSTPLSSYTISYANGTQQATAHRYAFDITKAVEGWRTGNYNPNKGILFKASSSVESGTSYKYKTLASYNRSSHKPSLSVTYSTGTNLVSDDTYYLNNLNCGDYLRYTPSGATATSGLISDLGNSIRWEIKAVSGGYVIRSKSDTTKYLGVPTSTSSSAVSLVTVSETAIPSQCIWKIQISSEGGCLVKSAYNSRYLYSAGNAVSTESGTGTAGTAAYEKRIWRIASTTYYGNTMSHINREMSVYSWFRDYELEVGQEVYLTLYEFYDDEIWCETTDFWYSVSRSGKIEIGADVLRGESRGVVVVTATHKVTNLVIPFEVFVSNSLLTEAEKGRLYDEFEAMLGDGYANLPAYNILSVPEVVEDIIENDQAITNYCNEYRIPKEFVQSVLFREIWCYSLVDAAGDVLVQEYYAWKEDVGPEPLVKKTDSSTGLGQIFAETAIQALNHADDRGFISLPSRYNCELWTHVWAVWQDLHDNNSYNINCCALVILDCQYEFKTIVPYEDFFDYSETQVKKILARYNGTGEEAVEYAEICFDYFELFKSINS